MLNFHFRHLKSDLLVPLVSEAGGAGATAALGDDGTGDGTGVGDSMAKTTAAARGKASPGISKEFY